MVHGCELPAGFMLTIFSGYEYNMVNQRHLFCQIQSLSVQSFGSDNNHFSV